MKKNDKKIVVNVLLLMIQVVGIGFYSYYYELNYKVLCSLCFVLAGIVNFEWKRTEDKKYPCLIMAGLLFGILGDISIYFHFYIGAVSFGIGHVLYILAYRSLRGFQKKDFVCCLGVVALALGVLVGMPFLTIKSTLFWVICIGYALVIGIMCGKALGNYVTEKSTLNGVILLGSAMFFLSDIMVMLERFSTKRGPFILIGSILYFPGMFALAQTIMIYFKKTDQALQMKNAA